MKVAVIYYSTFGHMVQMAEAIKEGVEKSGNASKVDIFQVAETLSDEVLALMHAPAKATHPIATNDTLTEYDSELPRHNSELFGTEPVACGPWVRLMGNQLVCLYLLGVSVVVKKVQQRRFFPNWFTME